MQPPLPSPPVLHLRDLTPEQKRSGWAAWLGWMFDGLDMHLYTLVAALFVAQLSGGLDKADKLVVDRSAWIQASFLIGWALGGAIFGRIGDWLGRSRALCLTILTYALFTGLSFFATQWWHLLIFRFVAALGIGGEWAVGASLLSETWPARWRPWIAAVLQTGVNIGVLLATGVVWFFAGHALYPKIVFLAGIVPAFLVLWIRAKVPEPETWVTARAEAGQAIPRITDLFRGPTLSITIPCIIVCACVLTAWWSFMFWSLQHLGNLPEVKAMGVTGVEQLKANAFALVIGVSVLGNFFAAWLARDWGYAWAITLMCLGFFFSMFGCFITDHPYQELMVWYSVVGFFSGVLGLFTMYLPPLFPVLLRTTGAGFCYNIGRVAAAAGTIWFGLYAKLGDFRIPLLCASFLFLIPPMACFFLPEPPEEAGPLEAQPAE